MIKSDATEEIKVFLTRNIDVKNFALVSCLKQGIHSEGHEVRSRSRRSDLQESS